MKRILIVLLMTIPAMQASAQTPQYWRGDWWQSHGFLGADSALLLRGADTSVHPPLPGFLFDTSSNDFFMWDDQIWTPITNTDTVETIEQLQNYSGASTILVLTDSLRGGLFYKSGNEIIDSGTVFNSSDGKYWVRQFNKSEGINAQWFGAHPDSSEDATSALRKAISYAAINKQQVIIPAGVYKLSIVHSDSAALKLPTNTKLIGKGNAMLVLSPTDSDWVNMIDIVGDSNILISNLNLIGNRHTSPTVGKEHCHGINITAGAKNIKIINCTIKNTIGDGIYIGNPPERGLKAVSSNIALDQLHIDSVYRNGISVTAAKDVFITNTICENVNGTNPQSGLDIEPNDDSISFVEGVYVNNFVAKNNGGRGVIVQGVDVIITNLSAIGNGLDGLYFLYLRQPVYNSFITNSIIRDNAANGVNISGSDNIFLSNLAITKNGDIGFKAVNSSFNLTNSLIDSSGNFGVDLRGASKYSTIYGCEIFDNAGGVHLGSVNGFFTNNSVYQNGGTDYNTGNALFGDGWIVTQNKIYANKGAGLWINSKNNVINANIITANSQQSNGFTSNIYIMPAGKNSSIHNNIISPGDSVNKPSTGIFISSPSTGIDLALNKDFNGTRALIQDLSSTTIYNEPVLGSATLSGDGATTDFSITISPGFTPSKIIITPTSSDAAAAAFYIDKSTITSTSFTVKATGSVPPSGTDNVSFDYELIK